MFWLAVTLGVFVVSFFWGMIYYPVWERSKGLSSLDVAVLASAGSVVLQSLLGLVINNFLFLGHRKSRLDFWSHRPFEFFCINRYQKLEGWRLARGRFLFYMLTLPVAFGEMFLYGAIRG